MFKSFAPLCAAFAIALLLLASGCSQRKSSSSEAAPPASRAESPSGPEDTRELSGMNIEQYRASFARELLAQYAEPEMEAYGAIWYPNSQKLFFRDIPLENGGIRHLNVMQTTDTTGDEWNHSLLVTVSESSPDGRVYLPDQAVGTAALDYIRNEEGKAIVPDLNYAEWVDERYFYLAGSSSIALFDAETGGAVAASRDPWEIYSRASGLSRSYLVPVAQPFAAGNKIYYAGFRDPVLTNSNGSLYELSLAGEQMVLEDVYSVAAAYENAVVLIRVVPGKDEQTPSGEALWSFDTQTGKAVPIFTDVYYELDKDFSVVGGQVLGNYWAGKQWSHDNPDRQIQNGRLAFYVSRIADGEVDQYEYDFASGALESKGVAYRAG